MTPVTTERTLKTMAYSWMAGMLGGALLGWLLVPAALPVDYLAPILITGPFAGFIAASGVLANRRAMSSSFRSGASER
jgi:hypothetical protein